jgi:hypothetical protein
MHAVTLNHLQEALQIPTLLDMLRVRLMRNQDLLPQAKPILIVGHIQVPLQTVAQTRAAMRTRVQLRQAMHILDLWHSQVQLQMGMLNQALWVKAMLNQNPTSTQHRKAIQTVTQMLNQVVLQGVAPNPVLNHIAIQTLTQTVILM